jgi:Polysaccharide lyase
MNTSPSRSPSARTLLAIAFSTFLISAAAQADVLWKSDPAKGLGSFENPEKAPGTITVVKDPLGQFGQVFQFSIWDDPKYKKERCEIRGTKGFLMSVGKDYYIGWRAMWDPMPIKPGWVALFQMHGYGPPGQGAPLVLRCINGDGNLYMQANANGVNVDFWHIPFKTGVWQTFVVHVFLSTSKTDGYVEIWYNGVQQTFANGQTRWIGPTWDPMQGSFNQLKWGVYRSGAMNGKGPGTAYMCDAKVGTSYADVAPSAGPSTGSASDLTQPGGTN